MPPLKYKFPNQLFVKKDESDLEKEIGGMIFIAEDEMSKIGEVGEEIEVAVYKLDHCGLLVTKSEILIKE